eukprot:3729417-Rhodomonas_salina.1
MTTTTTLTTLTTTTSNRSPVSQQHELPSELGTQAQRRRRTTSCCAPEAASALADRRERRRLSCARGLSGRVLRALLARIRSDEGLVEPTAHIPYTAASAMWVGHRMEQHTKADT